MDEELKNRKIVKHKWCTIFSSKEPAKVQELINDWLEASRDFDVLDIKYTANAIEFSALLFYTAVSPWNQYLDKGK